MFYVYTIKFDATKDLKNSFEIKQSLSHRQVENIHEICLLLYLSFFVCINKITNTQMVASLDKYSTELLTFQHVSWSWRLTKTSQNIYI